MKKVITINPVDDEMNTLATAVKILNDYKVAGFVKRDAFVELVMTEDSSYHTFPAMQKLNNFWAGRVKDRDLNDDLTRILEKLKVA